MSLAQFLRSTVTHWLDQALFYQTGDTSETTTSVSVAFLMRGLCYKFCLDTHLIVVCRTEQNTYGTMFRCLSTTRQVLLLRGRKRRGSVI